MDLTGLYTNLTINFDCDILTLIMNQQVDENLLCPFPFSQVLLDEVDDHLVIFLPCSMD
jgi:hypothetical protein